MPHPRERPRLSARKLPPPTADVILRKGSAILLERRKHPPFEGWLALPGGHVEYGETVEHAALRELQEEVAVKGILISILGVYSDPRRDPRGQRISTVFIADCPKNAKPKAGDDAAALEWVSLERVRKLVKRKLAFDHHLILSDYLRWLDGKRKEMHPKTFWSSKKRRS